MTQVILLTGATDGIGLEAAKLMAGQGHTLLLHGRNPDKLVRLAETISNIPGAGEVKTYRADLANLDEVRAMSDVVKRDFNHLDVLINNAGVFKAANPMAQHGYDLRFIVNVVAPYLLTRDLQPILGPKSRVVNLSSAAQAPVDIQGFLDKTIFPDSSAYAQSKLAITMWSYELAREFGDKGPVVIALNPASLLGSKMVKEAYGIPGHDLSIGADIITRAALSDEFKNASGRYYDNDRKSFGQPHADALDQTKNMRLVEALDGLLAKAGMPS